MAHKVLVNGTGYGVAGGKTRVNGTNYSIKSGRTLVGGTGYGIRFHDGMLTATVEIVKNSLGEYTSVSISVNDKRFASVDMDQLIDEYTETVSIPVSVGDTVTFALGSYAALVYMYINNAVGCTETHHYDEEISVQIQDNNASCIVLFDLYG